MLRSRRRHLRSLRWLVPVALVAVGAVLAARHFLRESTTPVPVSRAVARFRGEASAARAAAATALRGRVPEAGTYVYATRGFEEARLIGRPRHRYPARTTITVLRGGCGLRERWDVLETRAESWEYCPSPTRWAIRRVGDVHRFYGRLDRRTYTCTPGSTYLPGRRTPGTTWGSRCAIPGTTQAARGRVVGARSVAVAGRPVHTLLLRVRTVSSGDTRGVGTEDRWVLPRTGLLVRRAVTNVNGTGTVAGTVHYRERYVMTLTSLRPRR